MQLVSPAKMMWPRAGIDPLAAYAAGGVNPADVAAFADGKYFLGGEATDLSSMISLARLSAATYFDASGVMQSASSGVARDAHHVRVGGVWVRKGLLFERKAGTNFIPESEDMGAWTLLTRVSVSADQANGPDGVASMDKIIPSIDNNNHVIQESLSFTSGSDYAVSGFFRADENDSVELILPTGAFGSNKTAIFGLTSGAVLGTPTAARYGIDDHGGGLYHCWIGDTASTTTSANVQVAIGDDETWTGILDTYAGNASDGLLAGYVQAEQSRFPTSYIKTTGATAVRAAESLETIDASHGAAANAWVFRALVDYFDDELAQNYLFRANGSQTERARLQIHSQGGFPGAVAGENRTPTATTSTTSGVSDPLSEGRQQAINIALRATTTALQVAKNGTATAAVAHAGGVPAVSAEEIGVGTFSTSLPPMIIELISNFTADPGESGIEEATA